MVAQKSRRTRVTGHWERSRAYVAQYLADLNATRMDNFKDAGVSHQDSQGMARTCYRRSVHWRPCSGGECKPDSCNGAIRG